MNWKIFALFALTAGMHITVHASDNVNTPENRQFLKQQENLSRQLREKPDHQLKAWAEKQVLENPLQRSDNHFLDELVRKQQASQDGKLRQGALYFVSFSIPEEGLKRMLGETRHYGTHDARHDIDAKASKDFKEASDYFTSRKVSESGSHTDNNADSRVDQLSAALNSAKQSYDQYTTNMTRSHEYAEMASRTESMSGQMSEDLSQQFAQYVMKHAPQDAEAILTNTSSPEIAERRRAMAWSFVQEQVQPGVDNAWRESRGDIGKGMESVPSGGGSQDIIADHQGHQAIIDQRTQDSNIRNDVKHQVDNMVTEYKGNIGDTQNSIHGEENIVDRQYSELKNNHKQEEIQQNNRYNEENKRQKLMPTPSEDALKQMVDDKKERLKGPL